MSWGEPLTRLSRREKCAACQRALGPHWMTVQTTVTATVPGTDVLGNPRRVTVFQEKSIIVCADCAPVLQAAERLRAAGRGENSDAAIVDKGEAPAAAKEAPPAGKALTPAEVDALDRNEQKAPKVDTPALDLADDAAPEPGARPKGKWTKAGWIPGGPDPNAWNGPTGERAASSSPAARPAVARGTDPETSHEAAESITADGLRERQRCILQVFRDQGPLFDEALIRAYRAAVKQRGYPEQSESGIRTRRNELVSTFVRDSGRTVRLPSGRKSIVWEATP